jgi:hypothetical protein
MMQQSNMENAQVACAFTRRQNRSLIRSAESEEPLVVLAAPVAPLLSAEDEPSVGAAPPW